MVRAAAADAAVDDVRVQRDLDGADGPVVVVRRGRDVLVLLTVADDLAGLLGARPDVVAGLSRPFRADGPFVVSRREALWAVARARPGEVVRFGEGTTGWWLPDEQQLLSALVETVLGPVLAYDAAHGGQLLPSVRAWLAHDRRTREAAAALHVHPNTLAYRVRRFEELSGRSLQSTPDLAEVWLALQAAVDDGAR